MIEFLLNDKLQKTDLPPGKTLLDFIRYEKHLCGTKIGCREGDCGACTVLIGSWKNGRVDYRSMTSCLMPLANVHGRHVVTIEGVNLDDLNFVQQAMCEEGATQCGFCTPGFVVSLAGLCLQENTGDAIAAIDGNICRCTGYQSIRKAAEKVERKLKSRKQEEVIEFAVKEKMLPEYFQKIPKRLFELWSRTNGLASTSDGSVYVGGGTDLYVQKHDEMTGLSASFVSNKEELSGISLEDDRCILGSEVTVTDMMESEVINKLFPNFPKHVKLVSSTPIRNMATLAGNFVNASPIGDFTIFFLALNATVHLRDKRKEREVPLRDFYLGYKKLDRKPEEMVWKVSFPVPSGKFSFNFEKVCKRTHLDIASVNSAMMLQADGKKITQAYISAGGVGPIPMYLRKSSQYLSDKIISEEIVFEACRIADSEISPISDARGSEDYKRLLLRQLIKAHFIELIPGVDSEKLVLSNDEY